ncbi:MAG TPA: hypothetical protein VJU60_06730 [Thermoleophilaceae bacterium]|nr:hypothetical protein [Thermoleophilaceae bacterium]
MTKLVDEFDQLQPFPPGVAACPMDDGSFILALLAYPDGHRVRIEVDTTGCRLVSNGDVVRTASGFGTTAGPKLEHQLGRLTA